MFIDKYCALSNCCKACEGSCQWWIKKASKEWSIKNITDNKIFKLEKIKMLLIFKIL